MKIKFIALSTVLALGIFGCNKPAEKDSEEAKKDSMEETSTEAKEYDINTEESSVKWNGSDVSGAYGHEGTVQISNGSLELKGDMLTGGSITIDMTSMATTDDNYTEEKTPEKLIGHLSSTDFFAVEEYPEAMFEITSVEDKKVMGNLTVRDQTHEETVEIESMDVTDGKLTAKGKLKFDRQKYGVSYKSTMKDFAISDKIKLNIMITASAK